MPSEPPLPNAVRNGSFPGRRLPSGSHASPRTALVPTLAAVHHPDIAEIQLAITLGATVGGLLFDAAGYQSTFGASALLLLIGALLAFLTS